MIRIVGLFLILGLCAVPMGCQATAVAGSLAQATLDPYVISVHGAADGHVWVNARVLAIDAGVSAELFIYDSRDMRELFKKTFEKEVGQRAYELVFRPDAGGEGEPPAVEVISIPWERAREVIPQLPPTTPET